MRSWSQKISSVLPKIGNTRSISVKRNPRIAVGSSTWSRSSPSCRMGILIELALSSTGFICHQTRTTFTWHLTELAPPYKSSNASRLKKCYLKTLSSRLKLNEQHQLCSHRKRMDLSASSLTKKSSTN